MKKIILLNLILILSISCSVKSTDLILWDNNIYQNSKQLGIILKYTTTIKYSSKISLKQYEPNYEDIVLFEKMILNHNVINYNEFISKAEKINDVNYKFRNFKRQYSGYINYSNDTILLVNMISFKNIRKSEKYFDKWKSDNYIFLIPKPFEKKQLNDFLFQLNLTTKDKITILNVSNYPKSNFSE